MRILFASGLGHLPQSFGGVQSNTHEIALELTRLGHHPSVAAGLLPSRFLGFRTRVLAKLSGNKNLHDRGLGYPIYRRWDVAKVLPDLVDAIRPDVAVVQPGISRLVPEFLRLKVPTIVYFHDTWWHESPGIAMDSAALKDVRFLANSQFTATCCRQRLGIDAVIIPPLLRRERYQTARKPKNVTFINPHPHKGVDIALKLVSSCPEISFRFVKSWELPEEQERRLAHFARDHPNLTIDSPTANMKAVYACAKIILMPSLVEETWGRVASEAQFSGIPVIASDRGGLPEAVGPGGVLLDPEGPIDAWVKALRKLWYDDVAYAELSAAALAYASRAALDPSVQMDTFLQAAEGAIAQAKTTA